MSEVSRLALIAKPGILVNGGGAGRGLDPDLIQGELHESHSRGQGCVCKQCTPKMSAPQNVLGEVHLHTPSKNPVLPRSQLQLCLCVRQNVSQAVALGPSMPEGHRHSSLSWNLRRRGPHTQGSYMSWDRGCLTL